MITKMVAFYSSLHLQAKCNFVQHSNQPYLTLWVRNAYALKTPGFRNQRLDQSKISNENVIIQDSTALAMGNYFFTTAEGDEVKVEYSFPRYKGH